jgi:hypothetical protein
VRYAVLATRAGREKGVLAFDTDDLLESSRERVVSRRGRFVVSASAAFFRAERSGVRAWVVRTQADSSFPAAPRVVAWRA